MINNKSIVIQVQDIYKSYKIKSEPVTPVLKGLTMEIYKGEFLAIMGPSGAGKSTLLHLLGSLDSPDKGTIHFYLDGKDIDYKKIQPNELAKYRNKSIGFIFQFHHLLPEFTALENVMIPAMIAGESYSSSSNKAKELLKLTGIAERGHHKPMELSGGEQQRVAIARALINNPTIVLADEPTGNLDSANAAAILELIQKLRKAYDLTFVVATHSKQVADIAERVLMMNDGRIVA